MLPWLFCSWFHLKGIEVTAKYVQQLNYHCLYVTFVETQQETLEMHAFRRR